MHTNKLISESSPYLLQHAHNPVDWFPWGEAALQKAKDENKLIIISIGYSACHWCHVMEHESFENEGVAEIMNKNFISIKVDREERPDLDAIYMQAVQLITGRGGWPMNVIALPGGKPVYGGTYFRKDQWMSVLNQVNDFYRSNTAKCIEYGNDLATGVKQMQSIVKTENTNEISIDDLNASYDAWKNFFDYKEGGPNRAPKFPMPNNYLFLLRYAHATKNDDCLNYVLLTLKKIAYGGIYDHLAGGFARYSTDGLWKVPHFEKMLYDNAQLISLYSEAFQLTKNNLFKEVVYETFEFIKNELTSNEGSFYSALDADSEGEEGKFYVWKKKEIETILGDDAKLFCEYYNVNQIGFWEHENYILLRKDDDEFVATKNNLSVHELKNKIHLCKEKLLTVRNMRIKPGLDDKQLTSWNALMLKAYTNAFAVFNDKIFLEAALKNAKFIQTKLLDKEFNLFHNYKNGKTTIPGFLEDYAFVIEAWIELYQSTFNEQWLTDANELMQKAIENFFDERAGMFLFHSKSGEELFSHHFEIQDNVIPASNSSIANSLFLLGHYFQNEKYISMSKQMLNHVMPDFKKYGSSYSNWGLLALKFATPFYEVVISGKASLKKLSLFSKFYSPNKLFAGSDSQSTLPLLINRFIENKTLIYVCSNGACQLPVESADETMELITQNVD